MEFRSQKTACTAAVIALGFAPALAAEFRYEVRHDHLRKGCTGILRVDERGIGFQQVSAKKKKHLHAWEWSYADIQQLKVSPGEIRVLTYKDNKWKLGADREYEFDALKNAPFREVYELLRKRLDQRFVAELADPDRAPLWEVPVKHLGRFGGSEGVLIVGPDRIAYTSDRKKDSRTWRYNDVENISTSGPFQLTLTTYEQAKSNYGSLKGFNFQLKEPLSEERYNDLWRRLNESKGLKVLRESQP